MVRRTLLHLLILSLGVAFVVGQTSAQETTVSKKLTSEQLLPSTTKAWFSVPNFKLLQDSFDSTQFGLLTQDESLKPFIDSLKGQFQNWLNQKNVRLGIKIEDVQDLGEGEFCVAGVLDDAVPGRISHGMVLLFDVSSNKDEAAKLLEKIGDDLKKRNAKLDPMEPIHGTPVTRWVIPRKNKVNKSHTTHYAIAGGWLLASDNENVFREIIRRVVKLDGLDKSATLASQNAFAAVVKNTRTENVSPHFQWYLDPFGYLELAQIIEKEGQQFRQRDNDWAKILKTEGFDAFKGVGGQVAFATGEHELLHRTFMFAPKANGAVQKRVFGLFDFRNHSGDPVLPPAWVPDKASACLNLNWDMERAFDNVGFLVDAFFGEDTFESVVESLNEDPNIRVDLRKIVKTFGSRITIVSETEKPITENSERIVIGIPLKNPDKDFFPSISRALGKGNAKIINLGGIDVIEVDRTIEDEEPEGPNKIWLDEEEEEEEDEDGNEVDEFQLFEKLYFVTQKQELLVANNKEYLKRILTTKPKTRLVETEDYKAIDEALGKLIDPKRVAFRQFGRVDLALEAHYEMLRRGKMGSSNSVLARILNQVMLADDPAALKNEENPRDQKLDGSKLPSDYENKVAKYFGPMGWVLETCEDGWKVTGCMLKKKPKNDLVKKPEEKSRR